MDSHDKDMNPLVQLREVTQRFGPEPVFDPLSFELPAGRHTALLGPSGCGKSTLLRLIAGLEAPADGSISMDGDTVSTAGAILRSPHQRGVSLVFQDLALWPNLTAEQNVLLGLANHSLPRPERLTRAHDALEACRVKDFARRKPATLSVGQQQRVALARALAARPRLLLLDEPFTGLDPTVKTQLFGEIEKLVAQSGVTLLLVTHDPLEATALCQHALVLENGSLCEDGPLGELMKNPSSEILRSFVAQWPAK